MSFSSIFPDIYAWIKLIEQPTAKVIKSGAQVEAKFSKGVYIRYVVANDSNAPTKDFYVKGTLKKNNASLPNPVEPTKILLQSKQLWKNDYFVGTPTLTPGASSTKYDASLVGDLYNQINEEDPNNNIAYANFTFVAPPPA